VQLPYYTDILSTSTHIHALAFFYFLASAPDGRNVAAPAGRRGEPESATVYFRPVVIRAPRHETEGVMTLSLVNTFTDQTCDALPIFT